MSLLFGRKDQNGDHSIAQATDLIAKCLSEESLRKIIANYVGYMPGTLKLEMNPASTYNDINIDNIEYAKNFKDGWVFPNGTYIAKSIFPEMYEKLSEMSYPTNGKPKTRTSNGKECILLPTISGYLCPDNQAPTNKSIVHNCCQYSIAKHNHSFTCTGNSTEIVVNDAAWIWSTSSAGKGATIDATTWGGVNIPKTCTAHSGAKNTNRLKITWDMPAVADVTTTNTLETEGGSAILDDGSMFIEDDSPQVWPASICYSVLMFAGFPQLD